MTLTKKTIENLSLCLFFITFALYDDTETTYTDI